MATADSSETRLSYIRETVPGTTPATAPQEFRYTGESLSAETETAPNPEIRPGRQVQDEIRTRMEPRGDINIVFSANSHDELFEGVMTSVWGTPFSITANTTIAAVVSGANHDLTGTGLWAGLSVGDIFTMSGWTTTGAANNGRWKVLAKPDANTVRVHTASAGKTLAAKTAGDPITIKSTRLTNASVKNYYTIEKHLTDVTQVFSFQGCLLGGLSMTIEPNRILEGSFTNVIGQTPTRQAATLGSGGIAVVSTDKVMDAINAVRDVWLNHNDTALELSRLAFTIDNGLRGRPAIGKQGNADVALSDFSVTGELVAYFDGALAAAVYDAWLADTAYALSFTLEDANSKAISFDFPEIKFQNIQVVAGSKGQDMVLNCRWRAIEDPVQQITMGMYTNNYT